MAATVWLVLALNTLMAFADDLTVQTTTGNVKGHINKQGSRQFISIPFAAPPLGELRFKSPQPHSNWTGVKDCSCNDLGTGVCHIPVCLQSSPLKTSKSLSAPPIGPGTEDCLNLHVYTPYPVPATPAPVALWLHGGGFQTGDGDFLQMYSGAELAAKHGLVVVAPNYRLGALGFLAHKSFAAEDPQKSTGNYGILDQRLAMQWVQDNIARFGGNRDSVTLFGQSAGAMSIATHLVSPGSAGLFSAVVFESSSFEGPEFYLDASVAQGLGSSWALKAGCNDNATAEVFTACMRGLDAKHVIESTPYPTPIPEAHTPILYPAMPFGPVVDGVVLSDYPRRLVDAGKFHKVPVLLGSNLNEGTMFLSAMALTKGIEFPFKAQNDSVSLLEHFMNSSTVQQALGLYPLDRYLAPCKANYSNALTQMECALKWQSDALLRDFFFTCAARRMAASFHAQQVPTWAYQFTFDFAEGLYSNGFACNLGLGCVPGPGGLGVFHMSEIPFIFGSKGSLTTKMFVGKLTDLIHGGWTSRHQTMSDTMQAYWVQMVANATPNGAAAVEWPAFDPSSPKTMDLNVPSSVVDNLYSSECDFWDTVQV